MFCVQQGDDDLVDEDALLDSAEALPAPVKRAAADADASGCATKKRACKVCVCACVLQLVYSKYRFPGTLYGTSVARRC
jgi:hypothetical protein